MNNMKQSLLMCDNTEGDGKAEIVMDYVMSWSLRHAVTDKTSEKTPRLHHYCRFMLHKLLKLDAPLEQIVFKSVKVWKEWQYMDLCVEIKLQNKGEDEYYALLVENKYYSPLHYKKDSNGNWRNQVDVYKEIFEKYYSSPSRKIKRRCKYALVTCVDSEEERSKMYAEAEGFGFHVFGFYDILDDEKTGKYKDSESEIFNEFWLRRW